MQTLHSHLMPLLEDWLMALGVLGLTVIITASIRSALKKLHKERGWTILRQLSSPISNVLYIIGLKVFVDVAPLSGRIEKWADSTIYVLAVVIYLDLIQRTALIGIEWTGLKSKSSKTLQQGFIPLMRNVITLFVFFSGCIMILKHFNYDVMSLVTALGVSSLAVGLAAKDTLSNMISGFTLIIDRNIAPGDRVNLGGAIGDVQEIGLRSTQLKMGEGNTLIVPNTDLVNTKILNLSVPSREISCSVLIRVPYSILFSRVKSICQSTLNQMTQVSKSRPSWVQIVSLSDGHQTITIGFWVNDLNDTGAVISDFHESLLARLQQENIPLLSPPAIVKS